MRGGNVHAVIVARRNDAHLRLEMRKRGVLRRVLERPQGLVELLAHDRHHAAQAGVAGRMAGARAPRVYCTCSRSSENTVSLK